MGLGEFELIDRYFCRPARRAEVGVGDDCAVLAVSPGMQWAVSTDMLVEGRHFLSTVAPERLGHKSLAVNLSDLAACGARPVAFTLALALPRADPAFLEPFTAGLMRLADSHGCELVGGDTTAGPLTICITVFGEVPAGTALLRSGACAGDDLYVSGQPGMARIALEVFRGSLAVSAAVFEAARLAMEMPQPRVALGLALRGVASSAVDVSDGLLGDLAHLLDRSCVGASIEIEALPRGAMLRELPQALQREFILAGGDDYELLFSAPPSHRQAVEQAARSSTTLVTRIGTIDSRRGLRLIEEGGAVKSDTYARFDHFRT